MLGKKSINVKNVFKPKMKDMIALRHYDWQFKLQRKSKEISRHLTVSMRMTLTCVAQMSTDFKFTTKNLRATLVHLQCGAIIVEPDILKNSSFSITAKSVNLIAVIIALLRINSSSKRRNLQHL